MYYKIIGPTQITRPDIPPDSAWVDNMQNWAFGTTVLFIKFTKKYGNEYGARVKICGRPQPCRVWPKRKLSNLELPYSWLEPLPNVVVDDGWGIGVGPMGLMVIKMR